MRIRREGTWRDVSNMNVRFGGSWRRVVRVRVYTGGAWRDAKVFAAPLSLSASPNAVLASIFGAGTAFSEPINATPSGGLAPYTYSWALISGSGSISNPTNATTGFFRDMAPNEVALSTFRCTVTDALSGSATADVSVTFRSITFD